MNIVLVDLGLTSGTRWADRNIGADKPEENGDYFRFGETVPFNENSSEYVFDKREGDIAGTDRDAATMNLGKNYRMPTIEQIGELLRDCKWKWTAVNGVNGMRVTGPNGNSIFLPASGYRDSSGDSLNYVGSDGYYWSASPYSTGNGYSLGFVSSSWSWFYGNRAFGFAVRPVGNKQQ